MPGGLYRSLPDGAAAGEQKATITINGARQSFAVEKGYARIHREWKSGDTIRLALPMAVRRVVADERVADDRGMVAGYTLRQRDPKRQSVLALKTLYYRVIAAGDSYNDTTMLGEADQGILFHAPQNVIEQFPQFPAVHTYEDLKKEFIKASNRQLSL